MSVKSAAKDAGGKNKFRIEPLVEKDLPEALVMLKEHFYKVRKSILIELRCVCVVSDWTRKMISIDRMNHCVSH